MTTRKDNYYQGQLFKPSQLKNQDGTAKVSNITLAQSAQDSFGAMSPTGSFRFDPAGSGLKNTQQINVDFSKFENHTFFNSARNKVQIAFDKIINNYPFDGTRVEHEKFFNGISGFEKHVFDRFPKNTGFLIFSRSLDDTADNSLGNYLSVKDYEGSGLPDAINDKKSEPKLDFESGPFSVEFSLYVPSGENDNEIITQRLESQTKGFTIGISASNEMSSPTSEAELIFVLSDEYKSIKVGTVIDKAKFNHIAAVYDRGATNKFLIHVNGQQVTSSNSSTIGGFNFVGTSLLIGSGSKHVFGTETFEPQQTLSGAMDEYRFFKSARSDDEVSKYRKQELYAQSDLSLYFRFNEPSGTFSKDGIGNSSLVIDYSGNGMHTFVNNFDISQRVTGAIARTTDVMLAEDPERSPVLFPSFDDVQSLATELITSASNYDFNNPNIITKLVPNHYLDDAAASQGYSTIEGELDKNPGMNLDQPGGNKLRQSQIVSSVLFTWAETFDEVKMFIDDLGRALKVDYLDDKTISDHLLPFLAHYHGFTLPAQFNSTSLDQYLSGRNLRVTDLQNNLSLQKIQNTIWRRILTDLPEIRRSKGTRASFRSVLRNMGINPDGPFRLREYGGSPTKKISDSFERRAEVASMMNFSGTLASPGTISGEHKDSTRPLLLSDFLSGSRTEPGYPIPAGTISKVGSTNSGDGLFTSGSWTAEGVFKFESKYSHPKTQSLLRMHSTGTYARDGETTSNNFLLFNVVAHSAVPNTATTGSVTLYGRPLSGSSDPVLKMTVHNTNVMDGNKWHVSFGRDRNDNNNHVSSSYFLRVGRHSIGGNVLYASTSSYYLDKIDNPMTIVTASNNASGAYIAVGSMSLGDSVTHQEIYHLNETAASLAEAQYVTFTGKASSIRFFSKSLTEKETKSHINNFKSIGVDDPKVNFNFITNETGSFEKLRLDMNLDQVVTKSDSSGNITGFDFSQNDLWGVGTGFEVDKEVISPERFDYVVFSPKFELNMTDNKIRVRSHKSAATAIDLGTEIAPLYEMPQDETPTDDRRFEIEVSSVQALNEDIMTIFSTLDFFDNAIGDPELVFSQEYRDLRHLRRIYFNRLVDKVSLKKFFEFFMWFDNTVGDIFEELIPRTTRYLGTNFVIESHTLERPKFTYGYHDMYLGELDRRAASLIFLQQYIGTIKKF